MKIFKYSDAPIEVHGLPFYHENGILERVPAHIREAVPSLSFLGRRCPGARLCFRTGASRFKLRMELETLSPDIGMSIFACQSANVLIGDRPNARFAGLLNPPNYQTKSVEKEFWKSDKIEDVTIFLPRNEVIANFEIEIDDDAELLPPTPYRYPPMLYYGSSITEGGCCARLTNAYNAIISNRLNADYYNYGFSGSAKGEPVMAELIAKIPMSIFVYDYDHNAPSAEHLEATHEAFFRVIREANPDLPVIILTKPDFDYDRSGDRRRAVIRKTYENAVAAGDKNVWFIDGETFFGDADREFCTCDQCHPNDLGFYRMADVVEPVVRKILEARYPNN
ncbi:MAG: hypothetical protein E7632_12185 [Ruminococcaceae bacterium]|nr:hypothetical protein [Oscillospiraceae bacterium]